MADKLLEQLQSAFGEGVTWEPEEGEILIGKVLSMREVQTRMGKTSYIADIVRESDGVVVGVWLNAMLLNRWKTYDIKPGDRVGIKYHGKRKGSRFEYNHYTLLFDQEVRKSTNNEQQVRDGQNGNEEETPF